MSYDRDEEVQQYAREYESPRYGMGPRRQADVGRIVDELDPGAYLDISTGRGEALTFARVAGHDPVMGTEAVEALCDGRRVVHALAHEIPFEDESFDHVTCFDVLEHLIEDDIRPCLAHMLRIARKTCTVSASARPSVFGGRDLHISKRPDAEWDALIKSVWGPSVEVIGKCGGSTCWQLRK